MKDYSEVRVLVVGSPSSFVLISTSSASQNGTLNTAQCLNGAFLAEIEMALFKADN